MVMIQNKFDKHCAVCGQLVKAQEGFSRLETGNRWFTYCKLHKPQEVVLPQKGPTPAPAVPQVRKLEADGRVVIQPWVHDEVTLSLLRAMPGRVYKPDEKCWYVSVEPRDRREVLDMAARLQLEVDPSLTNGFKSRAKDAEERGLFPYQIKGVDWLSRQDRGILGDEMGLGKTVEAIMALEKGEPVLVVCPANVKYNWKQEFGIWRGEYNVSVCDKRGTFRWPNPGEVVVVSYDMLPDWLLPKANQKSVVWAPQDLLAARRTVLICDEAHAVKNNKTARHKKVKQLSFKAKKVWFLTGTPLTNKVDDLLGLLVALNRFNDTFGTINNFVEKFNVPHNGFGYEWMCAKPSPKAQAILRSVMLRRLREEVLPELPEIQYQTLLVNDMPDRLRNLLDEGWSEYETFFQASSELPPFEEFSRIRRELAKARIPAMVEYVEDCEDQSVPLVVFSAHREPIDTLAKRKGWGVITGDTPSQKRQEIVKQFQGGELQGVGLTISAGGLGINLTRSHTALFVDLDWTPGLNQQAERRLLRIGQQNNVLVVHMVSDHPLDIHLHNLLAAKIKVAAEAVR